jgi:hypothetical protein
LPKAQAMRRSANTLLLLLVAEIALCTSAEAQRADGASPVDGIAALVGAANGDEGAATPVLDSDVALGAALGDLLGGIARGVSAGDSGNSDKIVHRAVLLAFLARQARFGGEEIDLAARQSIVDRVTANAGGAEALAELLERYGASDADLVAWAGDVALAVRQIEYLRERIEPPTEKELLGRFEKGDHPFRDLDFMEAKNRLRAFIVAEALRAAIAAELAEAFEKNTVRIFR